MGSKSTASQNQGLHCENWALEHYVARGFRLLARNKRFSYAEVDLLLEKGESLIIVEVKSSQHRAFAPNRVSPRQMARLSRCLLWLCEDSGRPVEAHLALVEGPGQVEVIEDFLVGFLANKW